MLVADASNLYDIYVAWITLKLLSGVYGVSKGGHILALGNRHAVSAAAVACITAHMLPLAYRLDCRLEKGREKGGN